MATQQAHGKGKDVTSTKDVESPVLNDENEAFLKRITAEQTYEKDRALVPSDHFSGADEVPLPQSPPTTEGAATHTKPEATGDPKSKNKMREYFTTIQSKIPPLPFTKDFNRSQTGSNLHDVAHSLKTGESLATSKGEVSKEEAEKEKADITNILDRLNISAINNRAFSFSKESQKLMDEFTQILKDLINGVPTAYDDLERLLTRKDKDLRSMFDKMPPFVQNLVRSLPTKMGATLAPGLMAAASERPGADGARLQPPSGKRRRNIPGLRNMVKGDAVVAMLRSILNFLKLRFPTLVSGTNVLLSLAVFLLLFVFWYCHKRGKEVRLEKERTAAEEAQSDESGSDFEETDEEDRVRLDEALKEARRASQTPLPGDKKVSQA